MARKFERELQALRERLLAMGGLAERMIRRAVAALVDRDARLAEAVLEHEEEMTRLCIEIDDRCFGLRRAPAKPGGAGRGRRRRVGAAGR